MGVSIQKPCITKSKLNAISDDVMDAYKASLTFTLVASQNVLIQKWA